MSKVRLSDLFPLRSTVTLVEGATPVPIRPVRLPEIVKLLVDHQDSLLALYNESQKKKPQYEVILNAVPDMIVDIICIGAEMEDQRDDIWNIPPGAQVQLLASIWELSVPDPKTLIESLSKLMAQAKRLAATVEARVKTDQASSQSDTPSSAPSSDSTST